MEIAQIAEATSENQTSVGSHRSADQREPKDQKASAAPVVREAHLRNSGRVGIKAEHQMPTFLFLFSQAEFSRQGLVSKNRLHIIIPNFSWFRNRF
jgi:hypothetical protein